MKIIKIFPFLFLLFVLSKCVSDRDIPPDKDTIVQIGEQSISYQEFETSYWLEPQYAIRTSLSVAYRSQTNYLIDQEYYYLAAMETDLVSEPHILRKLDYIRKREILKAYINENFLDTIRISLTELKESLHRFSEMLYVRNIFRKDRREIENLLKIIPASQTEKEHFFDMYGVDLGWITFGNLDPVIEAALYRQEPGSVSQIVRSSYGYHLLMISERITNQNAPQLNDQLRLQNIQEVIRNRKANAAIQKALDRLAGGRKIGVKNKVIDKITVELRALDNTMNQNPRVVVPPLSNGEIRKVELGIGDIRDETLVRMGDRELTVGQFIERIKEMPPFHRPYLKGRYRLIQGVLDMIRSDLLLEAALADNFDTKESVQKNIAINKREMFSRQFRARYNSNAFRENNSEIWQKYAHILETVKNENPAQIFEENLFRNISNPDSLVTKAPIQVMLKSRYIW